MLKVEGSELGVEDFGRRDFPFKRLGFIMT